MFLTAFYAGGMRFGDVCTLKPEHVKEDRIEYRMLKTGSPVSMPIPEAARAILRPYLDRKAAYVFPLLTDGDERDSVRLRRRISSRNVVINRNLKAVANAQESNPTGSRCTLQGTRLQTTRGRSQAICLRSARHSGTGILATTQQYLKSFDREAVDKMVEELWNEQ